MKDAVIYARYSSDGQREESIEDQIRECEAYAKYHDYNILRNYSDKALTGKTEKRPQFLQMIEDSKESLFDYIICYKTDRFFRNRYEAQKYKRILKDNGVKVIYAKVDIPAGPEGIILEGVLEALDEYYSANLSQNIRRGQTGNAQHCRTNGVKVFGYIRNQNDQYDVNESEAIAVNKVFDMVIDRCGNKEIIDWLNNNGYRNTKGTKFTYNAVYRIITCRKYIGEYTFGDIVIKGGMPAIVSDEKFLKANEVQGMGKAKRNRDVDYILSDVLYCGECGASMYGMCGTGRKGKKYYYYCCNNHRKNKTCDKTNVNKDLIENTVIDIINEYIFNEDTLNDIVDGIYNYQEEMNNDSTLVRLKDELKQVDKSINNIISAIEVGGVIDALTTRLKALQEEQDQLIEAIKIEEYNTRKIDKDLILFTLQKFKINDTSSLENKKRLVKTFVSKAFIYNDGKLVITFNYRKNGHLATHEEVNETLKGKVFASSHLVECKNIKSNQILTYITPNNVLFVTTLNI